MSGATKVRDLQAGTSGMMESTAMETEEYYNQEGGEWTQKVDTGQLCRVCASPNEYLIPIFDGEGLEHELATKIQKHLPIKVCETDTLPLHICYQCASTLIAWHDLVINCVEADKKLRELQVEEEDDDEDKGGEMFESHSMDSDGVDEVDQPSTSEAQSQVTKAVAVKKPTPSKQKKPKLKMVLVKGSADGTSGQKTGAKTQVAKTLELAKAKDGVTEESASERWRELSNNEIYLMITPEEEPLSEEMVADGDTAYLKLLNGDVCDDLCAYDIFGIADEDSRRSKLSNEEIHDTTPEEELLSDEMLADGDTTYPQFLNGDPHDDLCAYEVFGIVDEDSSELSNDEIHHTMPKDALSVEIVTDDGTTCQEFPNGETYEDFGTIDESDCKEETDFLSISSNSYLRDHDYVLNGSYFPEDSMHQDEEITMKRDSESYCNKDLYSTSLVTNQLKNDCENIIKNAREFSSERGYLLKVHEDDDVDVHDYDEDNSYLCYICGKLFCSLNRRQYHEKNIHKKDRERQDFEKIQVCEVCGEIFHSNRYFSRHMLKHGDKNFVCEICGKRFETNFKLKMHQECHSENRPYICDICGCGYKRYRNVLTHEKEVHGIIKTGPADKVSSTFACNICEKEFTTPQRVTAHMRIHTGERPFHCEECGNSFRLYQSLLYHCRVVHEGRKAYENRGMFPCTICKKVFSSKGYRKIHMYIHTGERPYVCKICGKSFTHNTCLIQHSAVHLDLRPYHCELCKKAFRRRETLIIHLRTHTGEKPHVCSVCGRGFAQLTDMKKHKLKIHKVQHQKCAKTLFEKSIVLHK